VTYRVVQESLSNIARHGRRRERHVEVRPPRRRAWSASSTTAPASTQAPGASAWRDARARAVVGGTLSLCPLPLPAPRSS
jgi:hypothetical protein